MPPERASEKVLLVIGPEPPPIGGGTVSVQTLLDELAKYPALRVRTVNTSPVSAMSSPRLERMRRALRIIRQCRASMGGSSAILVIGTRSFIYSLGAVLLLQARRLRIPLFFKPLGGDMGLDPGDRSRMLRAYKLRVLRAATGVLAQTRRLAEELATRYSIRSDYIPGYRPALRNKPARERNPRELHLVFLSHIEKGKGPFLLMEALRQLKLDSAPAVTCDYFGPIISPDGERFFADLANTPGARYCGVAKPGTVAGLLAGYDAVVFPTYHPGEGHPGVIIEAMQAAIPIISTRFMASPELIADGENGFLIPMGDPRALAAAIERLAFDPPLRDRMGQDSYRRGREFCSDVVIPRMVNILLPGWTNPAP